MQDLAHNYHKHFQVFSDIRFEVSGHRYFIDNIEAQSVTTILKRLLKPFARDYWSKIKAQQQGISVDEVLAEWDFKAKLSQVKGTLVHALLESYLSNSDFTYPEADLIGMFGYDPVQDSFNQILPQVDKFITDIQGKMLPIASELVVGDRNSLVCGTVDQIFFNHKSGQLEIWDWKTNKEIKTISNYCHLAPLRHIPDTELDHYSLQLSLYKLIIERTTGLTLGNCYLNWFNETQSSYKIFRTHDYSAEAELLLQRVQYL